VKLEEFMNSEYSGDKWYFVVKSRKRLGVSGTTSSESWYRFAPGHHKFSFMEFCLIEEFGEAELAKVEFKEMYGGYSVVLVFKLNGSKVFFYTLDKDSQVYISLSQDFVDWLKAWVTVHSM